jgi:formylmethanofuran dehydrogenase subunit E
MVSKKNNSKGSKSKSKKTRSRQEAKAKAKAQYQKAVEAHNMKCKECGKEVYVLDVIATERNGLCSMCYYQQAVVLERSKK